MVWSHVDIFQGQDEPWEPTLPFQLAMIAVPMRSPLTLPELSRHPYLKWKKVFFPPIMRVKTESKQILYLSLVCNLIRVMIFFLSICVGYVHILENQIPDTMSKTQIETHISTFLFM